MQKRWYNIKAQLVQRLVFAMEGKPNQNNAMSCRDCFAFKLGCVRFSHQPKIIHRAEILAKITSRVGEFFECAASICHCGSMEIPA